MREIKNSTTQNFFNNIKTISEALIYKYALKNAPKILTVNPHVRTVQTSFLEICAKYGFYPTLNVENSVSKSVNAICLDFCACTVWNNDCTVWLYDPMNAANFLGIMPSA